MGADSRSAARAPGREHIPIYPRGFIGIRIAQLVFALAIIGLAGYGISYLALHSNNLIMAVAVMTLMSSAYYIAVEFALPAGFNYWAVLGLDTLFVILWLIAFAVLTADIAPVFSTTQWSFNPSTGSFGRTGLTGLALAWSATQITAAALGGLEFVLFTIALVIHTIRLHRHRKAGLHCTPPGMAVSTALPLYAPANTGQAVPMGMYPQQQQYNPQEGGGGGGGGGLYPPHQQYQQHYPPHQQHYPPHQQHYPPHQQQQVMYPAPQGGYYVPMPMPMPMPMAGGQQQQQQPQQQQQDQQDQQDQQPPPQGYYAPPQPSGSPPPSVPQQQQQQQQQQQRGESQS